MSVAKKPMIILASVIAGFVILSLLMRTPVPALCAEKFPNKQRQVIMYSASWCSYCHQAREFFNENQITFCEFDVEESTSAHRAYRSLGGSGVPLIVIGEDVLDGFDEAQVRDSLQKYSIR